MAFEEYTYSGAKKLRRGYTTGTCAALAAQAATTCLLMGTCPQEVSLTTPAGIPVTVAPQRFHITETSAACAVQKDAGDDYDVTDGAFVFATVSKEPLSAHMRKQALDVAAQPIIIDGGKGVGRVMQPGLDQPVGNAAINSGPRKMITQAVEHVLELSDYEGPLYVLIEVEDGEELARKTFNPQIGIQGGISILGTSGIVEPQSLQALADALEVEVRARSAAGNKHLIITPGNYGENFLAEFGLPSTIPIIKCANFIGHTLDCAAREGFEEVLLVGHIGKLVKVAGSVMDTHSRMADCRREIFAAHAAYVGASQETIAQIFDAATTDACLDILEACGLKEPVLQRIIAYIQRHVELRVDGAYTVGTVIFSNQTGLLGMSPQAQELVGAWKNFVV